MSGNWFIFSIIALLFLGGQRFLYKVSAQKGCDTSWTTCSFMATVALFSSAVFVMSGEHISDKAFLIFIALLNSASFLVATMTHIEALKRLPAPVVYPLIRLSAVVVVLFSVLYFKDNLSPSQVVGIAFAIAVTVILTGTTEKKGPSFGSHPNRGIFLVFISVLAGSIATISSKFAAMHTSMTAFMAISYTVGTIVSFGFGKRLETARATATPKTAIIIGVNMGILNFAGFFAFLRALSTGPLSVIVSIVGMHFTIAVILSVFIYKEKLTPVTTLCVFLTVLSITMLRL